MADLKDPRWMWLKAMLLLAIGFLAGGLLLLESRGWRDAMLLALCVWGFCRAYYFAFYVIEKYVDSSYRFSGLISFLKYITSVKRVK